MSGFKVENVTVEVPEENIGPEFDPKKVTFRSSGDGNLNGSSYDSQNDELIIDYAFFDSQSPDTRFDLYVDGSFIENDINDMDFLSGNAIDLTGNSPSFEDGELTIAVDESALSIDHSTLTGIGADDHHPEKGAGFALNEDGFNDFNFQPSDVDVENLSTGSSTAGHVARADGAGGLSMQKLSHNDLNQTTVGQADHHDAGTGLNLSGGLMNVDDPLELGTVRTTTQLETDTIESITGDEITFESDTGGRADLDGIDTLTGGTTLDLSAKSSASFSDSLVVNGSLSVTGDVVGTRVPTAMVKVSTSSTSAFIDAQQGQGINSASRDGEGLYTIDHGLSGTISATVSVEGGTSSNNYPESGWLVHLSYFVGGITVQTNRIAWDSNNDVLQVSNDDPFSITVTFWST